MLFVTVTGAVTPLCTETRIPALLEYELLWTAVLLATIAGGGSALSRVLESRRVYRGNLTGSVWNQELVDRLGGSQPLEAVAVPLLLDGAVVAILYGDNLPETKVIGSVDGLEVLMREIGLAADTARRERG